MEIDEREPLLPKESRHSSINGLNGIKSDDSFPQTVYKRRWYILFLFCFLCFMQNLVWNTWGPLAESVNFAFGWSKAVVALQANWGCITYIVSAAYFSWLMDAKGLRVSCIITGALISFGSALRCITTNPAEATWLIHAGQILNGFAGPVLMAGPPLLSATWFPPHQRTTATSLTILSMNLGLAASFLIGPLLVPNPTIHSNISTEIFNYSNETNSEALALTRFHIMRLMYIECVCSVTIFLAVLIYFPDKPPLAPSISAARQRVDFKAGLHLLKRNLGFWKISLCYGVALGIEGIWAPMINFYVTDLVDQAEAGMIGFYGSVACGVFGCIVSRFTDIYARRLKAVLLVLFSISLCLCIIFTLECMKIIPFHRGILYSTNIGTVVCIAACSPLFFELVCETAFPVAEGLTNGIQTWLNNFVGLIFLLTFMIPAVGNSTDLQWMNWTMVAAIFICIPILLFYKENYNRLDLDAIDVNNTVESRRASEPLLEVNEA